MNTATETLDAFVPHRRRADTSPSASRIGVLWTADARTSWYKIPGTVLDISPDGARLRIDADLVGQVDRFRLTIDCLGEVECQPVWQRNGRVGVRFVGGNPTMTQIHDIIADPPYAIA